MATTTIMSRGLVALGAIVTTSLVHFGTNLRSTESERQGSDAHHHLDNLLHPRQQTPHWPWDRRTAEAQADYIQALPGLSYALNFDQFSGYLDVAPTRHVHYWYVESQSDPDQDPVVLWTNGGPGCSGLLGLGAEHGPFYMTGEGLLKENIYSWNKIANMLYVEQPAGTGFSYFDTLADHKTGDHQAAVDNYHLLVAFLERFPERRDNRLYIASESYGGHYMPQLAHQILYRDPHRQLLNFRGFLVGNPYVDPFSNFFTQFESYYGHGLLAKPLYENWTNTCRDPDYYTSEECDEITNDMFDQFGPLVNPYALDFPICTAEPPTFDAQAHQQPVPHHQWGISVAGALRAQIGASAASSFQVDALLNRTRRVLRPPFLAHEDQYKPCMQVNLIHYLNRPDVRQALHIAEQAAPQGWAPCGGINHSLADVETPVVDWFVEMLVEARHARHDLNMLIFSGDDDSVCSTAGTQYWLWGMGVHPKRDQTWRAWYRQGQVAGFVTHFDLGSRTNATFIFCTVHGAGHEVPAYRPAEALEMFHRYLTRTL